MLNDYGFEPLHDARTLPPGSMERLRLAVMAERGPIPPLADSFPPTAIIGDWGDYDEDYTQCQHLQALGEFDAANREAILRGYQQIYRTCLQDSDRLYVHGIGEAMYQGGNIVAKVDGSIISPILASVTVVRAGKTMQLRAIAEQHFTLPAWA